MAEHSSIRIIQNLASEIAEQNALIKQEVAKAMDVLKAALPDTFLDDDSMKPASWNDGFVGGFLV